MGLLLQIETPKISFYFQRIRLQRLGLSIERDGPFPIAGPCFGHCEIETGLIEGREQGIGQPVGLNFLRQRRRPDTAIVGFDGP